MDVYLRVEVPIRLLGVTVESISSGEMRTRPKMSEPRAAAVVAAEESPHGNRE
jgi:hypothetical protein